MMKMKLLFAFVGILATCISSYSAHDDRMRDKRATGCAAIHWVNRSQWGVDSAPTGTGIDLKTPVSYVFIHHTAGGQCKDLKSCSSEVKAIYNFHKFTKDWGDIGYSFLIGGEGRVYQGVGWDKVGAHTFGWNSRGIAICFIGTYTSVLPSAAMQNAAKNLILCGLSLKKISSNYGLYGHRDGTCTECPGNAFYSALKSWTNWHKFGNIKQYCPP